jgi:hypothetical protein
MGRGAVIIAVFAIVLALTGDLPDKIPAWALEHELVYRALVALALFAIASAILNVIALVFHGWLFTGLTAGPAQANAEKVAAEQQARALQGTIDALGKISAGADDIVSDLHERLAAVEQAAEIEPPATPPASLSALLTDDGEDEEPGGAA